MKALWLTTTFAVSIVASSYAFSAAKVGEPAPDFTLMDSQGKTQQLSRFSGKTVVLEWTNPECPFVKKHYNSHNMQKQQNDAISKGIVWLTINSAVKGKQGYLEPAEANSIETKWGAMPTAYLFDRDGKAGHLFGAKTTPHLYIVDSNGMLRYNGAIDSIPSTEEADIAKATPYVTQALNELASGKPISTTTTQPYGCNIKY